MDAPVRAIEIIQGVPFVESRVLKVADPDFPDDRTKDTLLPLLGYMGRSQLRDRDGKGAVIAEFIVHIDTDTSTVVRSMPAPTSSAISSRTKKIVQGFELYTLNDADVIRLEQGPVTIDWEVVRP